MHWTEPATADDSHAALERRKTYHIVASRTLAELFKVMASIFMDKNH